MTKEELEKEAEKYATQFNFYKQIFAKKSYLAGAEPREKRIKELEQELNYQKQARSIAENAVVDLTKEKAELKEQLKLTQDNLNDADSLFESTKEAYEELKEENESLENVKNIYIGRLLKAKEILQEYIRINLLPPIERNFDDEVKLF